jgi:uncharacterized lipoprotein NlpE involved in copper resistance
MNKKLLFALVLFLVMVLSGCTNRQHFDTTYRFDRAVIKLPNGEIVDGKVESWLDFDSSDSIQVKINGRTYYTHLNNVVLIAGR